MYLLNTSVLLSISIDNGEQWERSLVEFVSCFGSSKVVEFTLAAALALLRQILRQFGGTWRTEGLDSRPGFKAWIQGLD